MKAPNSEIEINESVLNGRRAMIPVSSRVSPDMM